MVAVIWSERNVIQHINSDICDTLYLFKFVKSCWLFVFHLTWCVWYDIIKFVPEISSKFLSCQNRNRIDSRECCNFTILATCLTLIKMSIYKNSFHDLFHGAGGCLAIFHWLVWIFFFQNGWDASFPFEFDPQFSFWIWKPLFPATVPSITSPTA